MAVLVKTTLMNLILVTKETVQNCLFFFINKRINKKIIQKNKSIFYLIH